MLPGAKIIRRRLQDENHASLDSRFQSIHPVLARVFAGRGIQSSDKLDYSLSRLLPPNRLQLIDEAAFLLLEAIRSDAYIQIIGDFDADGATGTAVAVLALRALGAKQVSYLVPNRFDFGYGLSREIVEVALNGRPDLIVTVDNGVSSIDGVDYARENGVSVLVTDHHLPGERLPAADVIVNPNTPGDSFPSKAMAGVGVVFYVMLALRSLMRREGCFSQDIKEPNLAELLDLVALGTVADLVSLDQNNRILVAQGLARINAGKCRPGLRALLDTAEKKPGNINTRDLAFAIAPRLNAAGRLEDISTGIECLLTDNTGTAGELAATLDGINRQRKVIQADMQIQANTIVEAMSRETSVKQEGYCLFDQSWHQGLVGLIASRIREQTDRPVVAFAPGNGGEIKGSARSVPSVHIRDLFASIATASPDLITKFGGHAMAAGLSIEAEKLSQFEQAFRRHLSIVRDKDMEDNVLFSDGELTPSDLTLELAGLLQNAAPWGKDFTEPVFDGLFEVCHARVVKEKHIKMQLKMPETDRPVSAIAFNAVKEKDEVASLKNIHAVYRLVVNEYRGEQSPELLIDYFVPC